jgi:hypothetical protein
LELAGYGTNFMMIASAFETLKKRCEIRRRLQREGE